MNSPACQIQEEIIIIDEDEEDNVVVEAMVRSVQVAEDEAFARSLQVGVISIWTYSERSRLCMKMWKILHVV